jgi:signal transduction histidine kinase
LVENAIQASPRNGVVCLEVEPFDRGLRCEVTDQGPGLSEAALKHLFVAGRGSRPGGHGLGLAISHQLARHLGGEVRLGRTGCTGSTFVLELPEVVGRQEQSPVEPPSPAAVV